MMAKDKALVTMWERRMELEGFAAVMETVRNGAPGLKGRAIAGPHAYDQIPGVVERGKRQRLLRRSRRTLGRYSLCGRRAIFRRALVTVDFATKAIGLPIETCL